RLLSGTMSHGVCIISIQAEMAFVPDPANVIQAENKNIMLLSNTGFRELDCPRFNLGVEYAGFKDLSYNRDVQSFSVPSADITYRTLILNKEQDLICRVWGFYPESIIVSWFLNGSLVESTNTRWINSSAVETVYMFTPTEENQGLELSCEVEHDTLSSPLVTKLLVEGKGETRTLMVCGVCFCSE
uniref:Ig-like domain-containing protein n=1 Tax=Leptobrachium leishanense TaxID=445787 RepID=A0A8C5PTS4_9ANUR